MKNDSGATTPVWMSRFADIASDGPLAESVRADVCVVGAGIAGLTVACLLAREGRNVVVLEDGAIGGAMTARTTAHLVTALDDRYYELEKLFGEDGSRLAAQSHAAAIDRVESLVATERIACDFERLDGYLFTPPRASKRPLTIELEAARRAGLDVELVDRAPLSEYDTGACLRFSRQAQFHPLKYVAGLARAVRDAGGRIFTDTHADVIKGGRSAHAKAGRHTVRADAVVLATNAPVNDRTVMHKKQVAYLTYVIGGVVPRGSVTRALYWDTPEPYHYIRLLNAPEGDVLIVGGEDEKTGKADDGGRRFAALERWTRTRFPMVGEIAYRWSGQVMEPADGLAFIGRSPVDRGGVFIATGDSGNGLTHGTIAGMLLADLIQGRPNAWARLYDPRRKAKGRGKGAT